MTATHGTSASSGLHDPSDGLQLDPAGQVAVAHGSGVCVGLAEGLLLGLAEGLVLGLAVGLVLGLAEGLLLGLAEGLLLGLAEGRLLGLAEGLEVGHGPSLSPWAKWAFRALSLISIVWKLDGLPGGMWQTFTFLLVTGLVARPRTPYCVFCSSLAPTAASTVTKNAVLISVARSPNIRDADLRPTIV